MRRHLRLVVLLTLVGLVLGAPTATAAVGRRTPPPPPPPPFVLVYGDSLIYESSWYANDLLRVARTPGVVVGAPGGATCDMLPQMRADAARYRPTAFVIAFSGNSLTPCMRGADGKQLTGRAWLEKYRRDTVEAIATFRAWSPQIWLGTTPISLLPEKKGDQETVLLNAMFRELATQNGRVHIAESAAAVLDHGYWTRTLPCLPNEPCTGGVDVRGRLVNVVRSVDGTHFCPEPYGVVLSGCPTHASGALRFASALLLPTLRAQGLVPPERLRGTLYEGAG